MKTKITLVLLLISVLILSGCKEPGDLPAPPDLNAQSPIGQATDVMVRSSGAIGLYNKICPGICTPLGQRPDVKIENVIVTDGDVDLQLSVESDAIYESVYLFTPSGLKEWRLNQKYELHPGSSKSAYFYDGSKDMNNDKFPDGILDSFKGTKNMFYPGENILLTYFCKNSGDCNGEARGKGKWVAVPFIVEDKKLTLVCTDSDGGNNPGQKGTTQLIEAPNVVTHREDICGETKSGQEVLECFGIGCVLLEYYCVLDSNNNPNIESNRVNCDCKDGACVKTVPKPSNLVAEYTFEGNTQDSAGSNHGKPYGNLAYAEGFKGKALVFDGVDDYVNLGNTPALSFGGTKPFTFSMWVLRDSHGVMISRFNAGIIGEYILNLGEKGNIYFAREVNPFGLNGKGVISINQWNHVVATYDGTKMKIYINGLLDVEEVRGAQNTALETDTLIGAYLVQSKPGNFYNGKIDELKIYNTALSAGEILTQCKEEGGKNCGSIPIQKSPIVAEYTFDEGTGTKIADSVGSNHGTTNGGSWISGLNYLNFNGIGDCVTMDFDKNFNSNEISVAGSFKTTSKDANVMIFSIGGWYALYHHDGKLMPLFDGSSSGNPNFGNGYNDGNWHQFVASNNGILTSLYVDGNLLGTTPENIGSIPDSVKKMALASQFDCKSMFFNGAIDNIRIYNKILSQDQVLERCKADGGKNCGIVLDKKTIDLTVSRPVYAKVPPLPKYKIGDVINFKESVWNKGTAESRAFIVEVFEGSKSLVKGSVGNLAPDIQVISSMKWTVPAGYGLGERKLTYVVDSTNVILETDETNNKFPVDFQLVRCVYNEDKSLNDKMCKSTYSYVTCQRGDDWATFPNQCDFTSQVCKDGNCVAK